MGSYQDRKDIDRLYRLIWDSNDNQLNLVTKEELKEVNERIDLLFELYESLVNDSS